jgi:CHAD domain-containing protein
VAKRSESHRQLARALRSVRYRHLVESTADWIESGPWSMSGGSHAARQRAVPIAEYSAAKLAQWLAKLLRKSRRLLKMDAEERHRLRLLNKKLSYSIETFEDLFSHKRFSRLKAGLKHLRRAQRALGQLNDDTRGHALAAALPQDGAAASFRFLSPKREKRLLQTAVEAYRKLAASAEGRGKG